MATLMTDGDRYEELAAAAVDVLHNWEEGDLAGATNALRETLVIHGTAEHDEDCIEECSVDPRDKCRALHSCWCAAGGHWTRSSATSKTSSSGEWTHR